MTDAIALLRQRNERVLAQIAPDANEILGCNTRADLADVDRIFRARKAAELMDAGVTIYLPETVVIDPEVTAGPDTVIEPGVQLLGKTRIGARCKIRTGSILRDVRVDDDAVIGAHSILNASRVGAKRRSGPFARLRPGADIRAGAHVGNFVEVKNSVLHEGAKAKHLTYLGDATIGRGIEYRRRNHHMQLRRRGQVPDHDRQPRIYRQRHRAGRAGADWRRRVCGGRIHDHGKCSR